MDRFVQAQPNIRGSYSGNHDSYNFSGSDNAIGNTYVFSGTTNFGVGTQSSVLGAGNGAPGPYRLIPYARNITFTSRGNLMELVRRLGERKGHNRIALHGLGGSGKTQIALDYVHQRASESNCNIFWVQGSGMLKFSEGFRTVAQHIQINLVSAGTDEEALLLSVRRWFEGPGSGDWILVVDNADNEADYVANNSTIAKFLPQGAKGTLIITTRSRQVASRQGCKMIEVGKMAEEEAEELFSKRFGSWDSLEEAEKKVAAIILDSVHHLPLAVVGAAAFMVETETPPSVYWSIFQEGEERVKELLSQEFSDIQRESDITESILGTYFVTFDRISQQMRAAADLLLLMAFFDRQNIPEELLRQSGIEGVDDSIKFRRAIGKLLGFSLVTMVKRENKTFYELHRLVQLSLQVYLPTEELNQWRASALHVVSRCIPQDRNERRRIGPAYIPHALSVTKGSTDPVAEKLCYRMGQYFLDMGFYNNAEVQVRRCIALRDEGKGHNCDDEGDSRLALLGVVNECQGKYYESEAAARRALEGYEKARGPNHPHTLTIVNNLAVALWRRGEYGESEKMSRHALKGREEVLGPDHPDTLTNVNTLATVLADQGKYDESEKMNRRALEGRDKVLGPNHPGTLTSVNNLATVLRHQGKYDESEKMSLRALEGREKVLGPDHPDTLASVSNLATVLQDHGKYDESEKMNLRALEGREKVLGPDHPDTLTSVNNLALVLLDQGNYEKSEKVNRRALEGREKVLGPDHPHTLSTVNNLAAVLQRQGKYDESERMNRRALGSLERVLGPDHPNTLSTVNNLALVLQDQGKYDESERMNRRALGSLEKVLGPDHPNTLSTVNNLAFVLRRQGKYDESEKMNRRALEGRKNVLGPDHPNTLGSIANLAAVLRDQGKYDESEVLNRRSRERLPRQLDRARP